MLVFSASGTLAESIDHEKSSVGITFVGDTEEIAKDEGHLISKETHQGHLPSTNDSQEVGFIIIGGVLLGAVLYLYSSKMNLLKKGKNQ